MLVIIATIVLILICAAVEARLATVVSLQVRPRVLLSRGDVRVTIRVPADVDNRRLAVAWDSDTGEAGMTTRRIDGEDGPTLFTVDLRDVPPANYTFVATVFDQDGHARGRDEAFIVTPSEVK